MARVILGESSLANFETRMRSGISGADNPDKLISRKGMEYIEDIERDTHLDSCLNTRIQSVVSKGWGILPHVILKDGKNIVSDKDQEIADFVRYNLEKIPTFETDIVAMFDAIGKGFSISEINYQRLLKGKYQGKIGLKNLRKKPAKNFSFDFDNYGRYTLFQVDPKRIPLNLDKFIHIIAGKDDENPWGESASSKVAFWVWLKKNGAKFWAIYAERFGMPLGQVKIPRNTAPGSPDYNKGVEVLEAMLKDSGLLIPEGFDISYLEAMRSGDASYGGFIEQCNKEISKEILGATLTIEEGKRGQGSYALGSVHSGVLHNYTLFDVVISSAAINYQLIRRLVDLNYDTEFYPRFFWNSFNLSMLIALSQNIDKMAQRLRIPTKWIYESIGIPVPEKDEEILDQSASISQPSSPNSGGVDNKVIQKSEGNDDITVFAEKDIPEALIKRNAKFVEENEKIFQDYQKIMADNYSSAADKISKLKKHDQDKIKKIIETNISESLKEILLLGYLQGKKHASIETGSLKFQELFEEYDPFKKLLEDFYKNNVITKAEFELLEEEMRREAFTIAGIESVALLYTIRNELAKIVETGGDWGALTKNINKVFEKAGVTLLSSWHLGTVIRTNLQTLYSRGREELYAGVDRKEFPYKMVLTVGDDRTRESHQKLHGFIRPIDDPIWNILKTPFDFNCRCTIIAVPKSYNAKASNWMPDMSELGFVN